MRPKPSLRRYAFEFSCILRPTQYIVKTADEGKKTLDVVPGFAEGAHFYVEIDYTVADVERWITEPPQYDKAIEAIEDLVERRFEGCPILTTPISTASNDDDPIVVEIEALTQGRAYFLKTLDSDAFASKFFQMARSAEFNVAAEEVRVRRAGDDYTAIERETDDEA